MPNSNTIRTTLGRFEILADADLHIAVMKLRSNKQLCASFSAADVAMIATVGSELGRNILKYGGARGHLLVTWIEDRARGKSAVEIQAVDYGPGFIDVAACLMDHYSTGGTLGLGLPGSARIMDLLEIEFPTRPGRYCDGQEMGEATCKTELTPVNTSVPAMVKRCLGIPHLYSGVMTASLSP